MTVYVDNMRAPLARMKMCHMLADTTEELHAMADAIGVDRKWCQAAGTYREHYDISLSKRALAIQHGAVEVTRPEVGFLLRAKREAFKVAPVLALVMVLATASGCESRAVVLHVHETTRIDTVVTYRAISKDGRKCEAIKPPRPVVGDTIHCYWGGR